MAEEKNNERVIEPEEKPSGSSWLWWVFGVLAAFLLIVFLIPLFTDDQVGINDRPGTEIGVGGAPDRGTITNLGTIINEDNPDTLTGQSVRLNSVSVISIVGDGMFWVGNGTDQRLLVSLGNQPISMKDAGINLTPGQIVTVAGQLQRIPDENTLREMFNLNESETAEVASTPVFLQAEEIVIERG
ncbi:MAG: hypothetical protein C4584_00595 [Armatimonadetes bacterium]|nr:MAG: hypothetical protein C4584_00595 [Armatimonadota bacterium]